MPGTGAQSILIGEDSLVPDSRALILDDAIQPYIGVYVHYSNSCNSITFLQQINKQTKAHTCTGRAQTRIRDLRAN